MRVDAVQPPSVVTWFRAAHTRNNEWTGSSPRFQLTDHGRQTCELDFATGLAPELVADGRHHFLTSLAGHAERRGGSPIGAPSHERSRAPGQRPAR